ncbi:MAG TPA: SUF system NifU family Fe-S cluster assembly protein [Gemmataceae bacterium]|nr:SUF system NifU family Fe-S cluster assembly protein [Gemmataceae bacterium]
MTQELRELYNDMILEHARSPRNYRAQGAGSLHMEGHNPLCGDHVTVYAAVEGDVVKDVSFQGNGCAVSKASASVMTQLLKGKTLAEAEELYGLFHDLLTGKLDADAEEERLGKLAAFKDVPKFPVRVKCATLAWHTLHAALHGDKKPISTE